MATFIGLKSLYVFITVSVLLLHYYGVTGAVIITSLSLLLSLLIYNVYKIHKDLVSLLFFITTSALLTNQFYYLSGINGTYMHLITVTLAIYLVVWNVVSYMSIVDVSGADIIEDDRVYMVFKKPDDFIGIAISLIGYNSSSLSFCMKGEWLRFVKKDRRLIERDKTERDGFVFIDIGHSDSYDYDNFKSLKGSRWSLKSNCVSVWKPFLKNTRYRVKVTDLLPSNYVLRILKEVKND